MRNASVEAAYSGPEVGRRTACFILDLPGADMIPQISEPPFVNPGADVEIKPVMNVEDLKKRLEHFKLRTAWLMIDLEEYPCSC